MSVLDSGTPADIVERVRVKEEDNSGEIGEKIYTNDGNGYEAMDWKSNRHGNRAINSFSTQCQSASDDGNQGHCQLDKGERSDASGAKQCPEKTITVKTEPFSPDDPEYWHSSRYQDGDADFNTMRNKQSSADTSEDLQDGSDNDDQQFYIATEVSDVAMATDGSFQGVRGGSTELSSVATERLATIHGGNSDSDNAWQLKHGGHEEESQVASQCSNTSSYSRTPIKRSIYPIYNRAATWNVTSRACLTDAETALGRDTDKSTEAMPEPVHEIDAESQFSREGDKDAMDHAENDMQCKCVQCMGSVQSVELIQCRAMLKLPMGKDCGEFFRSLALFRLHEKHHNMAVSRVTCPSCLQTFPLFGNCGEHFWNAHNDGTTWQDDDPHLPAAESENYIQEYSEQQSENDVGHNMEPQPQFEILASENQSDSVVINTCSESLSSRNYRSEVSRSKHYTCKLCGELFNPFSLFCLHVKQRAQGVSTNTCPMCGQTFSSFCSLGRHFKNVHKNKITSVNVISIGNTSGNKPGDYSEQGPESGSLSSQSIDGSVNGASTDDEDAATDDEGNGTIIKRSKYWCQKCDKNFFKVFTFKIHESQHEKGLSQLQCPLCGWDYAHIKGVLNHFKRQHKSKLEEWGGGK
ncbi:uncharacterized protein [Ptychodera flava]|uniref:uncharacterized protein n=1 Tax=Ptychodera flava TaxID=63121 RepID=UPI00396A6E5F